MTEPTPPFNVRAIAAYEARNTAEVSLEIGKTYNVLQTDGKGLWWQTKDSNDGHIGWFPASYTEVIYEQPPASYVPEPQPSVYESQAAATPHVQQPQKPLATSASQSSVAPLQQSTNDAPAAGEKPPEPIARPQRQKESTPVYVTLQLVKAKSLKGEGSKTNPVGFIYRRNIMDSDLTGEELFKTDYKSKTAPKKTLSPDWNERFTINVRDAETEIICVRFANGSKFTSKGKNYLGEIEFPLRGAVRDFDRPNYKYKWYQIKGRGKDGATCTGEALIFIEFVDTRESAPPSNFEHKSHVGLTKDGAFDINNIPPEWKKIFKSVGLRKHDLQNNPDLAKAVIDAMENDAGASTGVPNTQTSAPPPPPPPVVTGPAPPPPPPVGQSRAPAPPPVPRPVEHQEPTYSEPDNQEPSYSAPPVPVVETPAVSAPAGGGSFLDAIAARTTKLRPVDQAQQTKSAPSSNSLADTLKAAMIAHRKDIEGDDNEEEDDDWSE